MEELLSVTRVLVIEDDANLLDDIVFGLRHDGFEVNGLPDGRNIEQFLISNPTDVVVLDVMLPGPNGFQIAGWLSDNHPFVGIVMLTGLGTVNDHVNGLESGADIYLKKTADRRELVAAIKAVSRRVTKFSENSTGLVLEREGMKLITKNGDEILLTKQEFLFIKTLALSYGNTSSRKQLIESMGHQFYNYDERRLETLVSRLRRKLNQYSDMQGVIRTLRAEGYLFTKLIQVK